MSRKRHTPADEPHFLIRTLGAEFADGSALEPHAHEWGQLIYAASGVVSIWTGQGSWVVPPPYWAVWAPAGVAHAMRFAGAASLRTLYIRPGLGSPAPNSSVVIVSALLRELIQRAVEIGMLDAREPTDVAIADLIVHELRAHATPVLDLPLPRTELLRRVTEHLSRTPDDRSGHGTLAQRFGVGVRTLERGFEAETGLSLGRWRRQARFLFALRRLGAGAPVKRAAVEAGYQSPSAFIAAFRTAFDTTPGRYFEAGRPARKK